MHYISKLMLLLWMYEYIIVSDSQIAEDGVIDCKVDCACCKNQRCGPNGYFAEDNCYDGCIVGYSGSRCYVKCPYNCTKCKTDAITCTECYNGYFPGTSSDCTAKCLPGCKTCTSNTTCTTCKDEYYNANGFTDCRYRYCPQNCECKQNQCVSCKSGYYDTSTSCSGICHGNCLKCSSPDICDVCRDGYYNGHRFDNSNLPLLKNCTYKCRESCERCSSYNTCLQCKTGQYGSTCQKQCSTGCETNECLIDSGNCLQCIENYSGQKCEDCEQGLYGPTCSDKCPSQCFNATCRRIVGTCTHGCVENYSGDRCCVQNHNCIACLSNTMCGKCIHGYYNELCDKVCPRNCFGSCDIETGSCGSCKNNFYGLFCTLSCSSICIDNVCNQDNGKCTRGCNGTTDDPVCPLRSDSTEETEPVTAAVLGSILAVSVVVNIAFVGRLLLKKIRTSHRKPMVQKAEEAFYENTGTTRNAIEMAGNTETNGNDGTVTEQASLSVYSSKKSEYEDIRNVQDSEHKYGQISPAATN